jgi:hypothetical protein
MEKKKGGCRRNMNQFMNHMWRGQEGGKKEKKKGGYKEKHESINGK